MVEPMESFDCGDGIIEIVKTVIERLDPDGTSQFHVSFDIDVADPIFAPGTGTRCHGGMTYRESIRVMQTLRKVLGDRFVSADLVEVDSIQDVEDQGWYHGND